MLRYDTFNAAIAQNFNSIANRNLCIISLQKLIFVYYVNLEAISLGPTNSAR